VNNKKNKILLSSLQLWETLCSIRRLRETLIEMTVRPDGKSTRCQGLRRQSLPGKVDLVGRGKE
jgi:hypothetical protein